MSSFDEPKNYYVYKYVFNPKDQEYSDLEGEIQAFVKGTNSMDAVQKAGFDDFNKYGARQIEDFKTFEKAIEEERKHLTKISKQLKEMIDEQDAEKQEFYKNRPCPNGCGKMDKKMRCKKCGFGYEGKEMAKNIDKVIQEEKKKGNDTKELESIRDAIKSTAE